MDEILAIEIMKAILIWIMGVRTVVEIIGGGIFHSILIMSVLGNIRTCGIIKTRELT